MRILFPLPPLLFFGSEPATLAPQYQDSSRKRAALVCLSQHSQRPFPVRRRMTAPCHMQWYLFSLPGPAVGVFTVVKNEVLNPI